MDKIDNNSDMNLSTRNEENLEFMQLINQSRLVSCRSLKVNLDLENDEQIKKFLENSVPNQLNLYTIKAFMIKNEEDDSKKMLDISFYHDAILKSIERVKK